MCYLFSPESRDLTFRLGCAGDGIAGGKFRLSASGFGTFGALAFILGSLTGDGDFRTQIGQQRVPLGQQAGEPLNLLILRDHRRLLFRDLVAHRLRRLALVLRRQTGFLDLALARDTAASTSSRDRHTRTSSYMASNLS
jgi:hypothetical protein